MAAPGQAGVAPVCPGLPVVRMAQDGSGRPTYAGRRDISRFMASVPVRAIPWREYTLNGIGFRNGIGVS